jgi:hypothetical protein
MLEQLQHNLYSVEETTAAIEEGKVLWLAGDEDLLKQLPKGRWIGATIPYFMSKDGGTTSREHIFIHELQPGIAQNIQIKFYSTETIHNITKEAPENGFSVVLIPALTDIHLQYAQNAPDYEDMYTKPVIGWVAGLHLDDIGKVKPRVFNGGSGVSSDVQAVVMHVTMDSSKLANIGIVNIQEQGDGDTFLFPATGFSAEKVLVNGKEEIFSDYLTRHNVDIKQPLVADYFGTMINVSFQEVQPENNRVSFYAPVFSGVEYKLAKPVDDYIQSFISALPQLDSPVCFSCNCILNYLYSGLEGKKTPPMYGPMTFGEIAYQVLNQTLVYLVIEDV